MMRQDTLNGAFCTTTRVRLLHVTSFHKRLAEKDRRALHRTPTRQSLPGALPQLTNVSSLSVDTLFRKNQELTAKDMRPLTRRLALQQPRHGSLLTSCSGRVCTACSAVRVKTPNHIGLSVVTDLNSRLATSFPRQRAAVKRQSTASSFHLPSHVALKNMFLSSLFAAEPLA